MSESTGCSSRYQRLATYLILLVVSRSKGIEYLHNPCSASAYSVLSTSKLYEVFSMPNLLMVSYLPLLLYMQVILANPEHGKRHARVPTG